MWNRKRILIIIAAFVLLSGCGKGNSNVLQKISNSEDMVYESSQLDIEGVEGYPTIYTYKEGGLYFITEEESEEYKPRMYAYDIESGKLEELPLPLSDNEYIQVFDLTPNKEIVYGIQKLKEEEEYNGLDRHLTDIVKTDWTGKETAHLECSSFLGKNSSVYEVRLDAAGEVVTSDSDKACLYFLDADLKNVEKKKVPEIENIRSDFGASQDEGLLCHGYKGEYTEFAKVNVGEREVQSVDGMQISGLLIKTMAGFGEYDFCYSDMTAIYGCDIEKGVCTGIMDFISSGVNPMSTTEMISLEDGSFLTIPEKEDREKQGEFILYKKSNVGPEDRTEISFGTFWLEDDMRDAIMAFNKENEKYRIVVRDYSSEESPGTKFNLDVATGNVPDIIDLTMTNSDAYISKGLVEDLTPYFEKDTEVAMEELIPSVLEAMKVDGKLYYVAPQFSIATLVGRSSEVGDAAGWTFQEFETVVEEKPEDVRPFVSNNPIEIYGCLIDCGVTDYIDWTKGTCNFDQENYRKILQFAKEHGSSNYANEAESNLEEKDIRDGKVLFSTGEVGLNEIQIYDYLYEGECNYIGYPNAKKEGSYFILPIQLGIYIKSEHKEAAWEVIKTFMTKEYQGTMSTNYVMPTRQDCFDWSLKAAMTEESYINDLGIEVEPRDLHCQIGEQNMEFGPLTQQQADAYVELVKRTNKLGAYYDEITEILLEEAQSYFSGKNSLDETIEYTQNRVNTYIKEKQ